MRQPKLSATSVDFRLCTKVYTRSLKRPPVLPRIQHSLWRDIGCRSHQQEHHGILIKATLTFGNVLCELSGHEWHHHARTRWFEGKVFEG